MSSARRAEEAHHELRPRRYMAGFPKWIVVVGEVPPVAVPLPMLDPEPSVVPGVGAS